MLFANFCAFSINSNLLYFIPKLPEKERECITQTAILAFVACLIGVIIIILGQNLILAKTSYNFISPLIFYIFFFLNFDFWESYWLSKKRSDLVLYYSSTRTLLRTIVIILCAYLTLDVNVIIYSMAIVELVRVVFVFVFFIRTNSFSRKLDFGLIKDQLTYIIPLGVATTIFYFNVKVTHLFISVNLGVHFLALYTIGSYKLPIVGIIRSSVRDVIFPEMVKRNINDPRLGLKLWQKKKCDRLFFHFPYLCNLFLLCRTCHKRFIH
jgi:O-antigen/teichoic acid export membrane protein